MRKRALIAACALAAGMLPAAAQENSDLDLIPGSVADAAPPPAASVDAHGKYSLENAFGWYSWRGTFAVPYPAGRASRWANRISLDALDHWTLTDTLTATFSDRFSVSSADGVGFPNESVRNDLREAYLTWEALPETYLEAGRINVRYGVAFGYNPTDFFRTRTSVALSSSDPGAARNNRLGTVMLRAQHLFSGGAVEVIYAPKLHSPVPMGGLAGPFDPKIDQTNGADRGALAFSFDLEEFNPQLLVYYEAGRTKLGLNISHPIGDAVIAYASWSGGNAPPLAVDASQFGKRAGTLPSYLPVLPPADTGRRFMNALSLGAYWTGEDKETVSLEYNFNQAGFAKSDWQNWFTLGADPSLAPLLWYVRGFASDQGQPMSRHQVFARVAWAEPLQFEHVDIGAYVMTSLEDGSGLGQLSLSYDLSDRWSLGLLFGGTSGGRKSEWGSLPGAGSAIVQIAHYL